MDQTISYAGDPSIGVFARVFDDIAVVPPASPEEFTRRLSDRLDVEVVESTIQGSVIIGSLLAGNRKGLVVSGLAQGDELARLGEYREIFLLTGSMNAAGNVILANDFFAAVHPDMPPDTVKELASFLGVPVRPLTLGGIKTLGMAAVATNRGVVINPRSTPHEVSRLQEITDLPIGKGSVNMGSGLTGAGLLANSRSYIAGSSTSGYELGRIEDVFNF